MNEREQGNAEMRDGLPRSWWNIYQGCLQAGFDEEQSWTLLLQFILSLTAKVLPPSGKGPKRDTE